ncbi:unnamed protein product, partial [Sphacelaria rigidula]
MDQDVEAILNASDSEEDDNLNVQGVSLEDILREDDDGDYDGDNDHSTYYSGGGGAALGANVDTRRGGGNHHSSSSRSPHRDISSNAGAGARAGRSPRPDVPLGRKRNGDRNDSPGVVDVSPEASIAYSGDSYDDIGGGMLPPRTAFLRRDEESEDSRLLQQILKESEKEIAASIAERTKEKGFLGGGGSGGAGDLYGVESLLAELEVSRGGGGRDGDDDDDALQSLDVDRIIESMELEAADEGHRDDLTASASTSSTMVGVVPWESRRRSFTTGSSGVSRGADTSGGRSTAEGQESNGQRHLSVSQPRRAGNSDAGASFAARITSSSATTASSGAQKAAQSAVAAGGLTEVEFGAAARARKRGHGVGRLSSLGSPSMGGGAAGGLGDGKGISSGRGADGGVIGGALAKAEAAELRLLRGGNREMISPLQV